MVTTMNCKEPKLLDGDSHGHGNNWVPQTSTDIFDIVITAYETHGTYTLLQLTELKPLTSQDLRFPTSLDLSGSDAMNPGPNYSSAYIILKTNTALKGYGFSFTIGRGNNLCTEAAGMIAERLIGRSLGDLTQKMGKTWRHLVSDSQLRWVGPEKGAVHLGLSACVNALWDLWGRFLSKPVWQLVADMTPEEFVDCIDFRYILDAITPAEAVRILQQQQTTKAARLEDARLNRAVPAYTTQAGWLGFSDERMIHLIRSNIDAGMDKFKFKVGGNLQDDKRRLKIARDAIGYDRMLMMDANQVWSVPEAIEYMRELVQFKPRKVATSTGHSYFAN